MIGLIGIGRFGALTARYLAEDQTVHVYSRSQTAGRIAAVDAVASSLAQVCQQRFVIVSVPISAMPATLQRIGPMLPPPNRRDRCVLG